MARLLTVSNLIEQVRQLMDEANAESITNSDIVGALNRAQDTAVDILAKEYEAPLLVSIMASVTTQDYPIPEDAFEERIEKIECQIGSTFEYVPRIDYRDATYIDSTNMSTSVPTAYSIIGQSIRFYPKSSGSYPLRIWYLKQPLELAEEQGNVTNFSLSSRYVVAQDISEDLSTEVDSYESYVTIVNGQTGYIRGSVQIQSIDDARITFRSSPARSSVLGHAISGSLPTDLERDDLLCPIGKTAISFLKKPVSNFLVQLAVAELRTTKLGEDAGLAVQLKKDLEEQVRSMWAGQEQYIRVKSRNPRWMKTYTRNRYGR